MKLMLNVAIAATLSSTVLFAATAAQAQTATTAKPASAKHAASEAHVVKHKVVKHKIAKKKTVTAAEKQAVIPVDAVKWSCAEGQSLYLKGDMKRDQIITLYYDGKSFQLPRRGTTTGADRFYDVASGMDLIVIPSKAMLMSDKDDDRIADDCTTDAMPQQK